MSKDFPGGSDGKTSAYRVGDLGSIPGSGRFPAEGNGNPLQYSCLIHGVVKTQDRTEQLHFHFQGLPATGLQFLAEEN